jgi:hypothetical protein
MYGLLRASLLMNCCYKMSFPVGASMEEITEAREIGTEGLEGLDFPSILMLIPKN